MLIENFKQKRNLHDAITKMMSRVPLSNESLYEYVYHKIALIHKLKIPLSGEDHVNLIMGGIKDEQIKFSVETAEITEPSVLANHLQTLSKNRNDLSASQMKTARPPFPETSKKQFASAQAPPKAQTKKPDDSACNARCYCCDGRGHFARDCPEKRYRSSRQNSRKQEGQKPLLALEYKSVNFISNNDTADKYFKAITVDGKKIKCFIDLGSQCSLISEVAVRTLKLNATRLTVPVVLSTLGDFKIIPTRTVHADVVIDGIGKEVELFVVEKCVMNVDVLVGQNFSELDDIQYIKTGNTLRFLQAPVQKGVNTITRGVVHLGVNNPGVVNELLTVLNEYPMCIATNMSELGETKTVEMKIELMSTQPIFHSPRRYAESERRVIREIVEELLRNGVIRESSSPYASPVLLVSKKSGEKRLCVDYRALNKITVRDRYCYDLNRRAIVNLRDFSRMF
jgi:hypothetical protein